MANIPMVILCIENAFMIVGRYDNNEISALYTEVTIHHRPNQNIQHWLNLYPNGRTEYSLEKETKK